MNEEKQIGTLLGLDLILSPEHYKEINDLIEENKKLIKEKEHLKEIIENLTTMTVCGDKKQIKNTAQYKLELAEQRIDKAVEYIKTHTKIIPFNEIGEGGGLELTDYDIADLLEILGDKDE